LIRCISNKIRCDFGDVLGPSRRRGFGEEGAGGRRGTSAPDNSEYGTNRAPVQIFYVPLPEEHVHDALRSIWGDYKPGTSRFGAQIWGDGDVSNGFFSLRVNILDDGSDIR